MCKKTMILFFAIITIIFSVSVVIYNISDKCRKTIAKKPVVMRKFLLNKLWRDKAATQLEMTDGAIIHRHVLNDEEYKKQLNLKILEEASEVVEATTKEDLMSEIGDVLEVLECIALHNDLSWSDILEKKEIKKNERGSYVNREYVTVAECAPDSWLLAYYLRDPERHLEIVE